MFLNPFLVFSSDSSLHGDDNNNASTSNALTCDELGVVLGVDIAVACIVVELCLWIGDDCVVYWNLIGPKR